MHVHGGSLNRPHDVGRLLIDDPKWIIVSRTNRLTVEFVLINAFFWEMRLDRLVVNLHKLSSGTGVVRTENLVEYFIFNVKNNNWR